MATFFEATMMDMDPSETLPTAQASSSVNVKASISGSTKHMPGTVSKRQQAAHKARMLALSKQLKTRLQYAAFKVEHGWTKQSLSEVENLFYKHRRASGTGTSPLGVAAANVGNSSTSPSSSRNAMAMPTTPTPPVWRSTISPSRARKNRSSSSTAHAGAFTGESAGGLVTPPMSGNTFPSSAHHERYKDMFSAATPSFASGLGSASSTHHNQRSRKSSSAGVTGGGEAKSSATRPSSTSNNKSYADFWSKIGEKSSKAPEGENSPHKVGR